MLLVALLILTALQYTRSLTYPWVYEDANYLGAIATVPVAWIIPVRALTMQTYHWTWQVAGLEPWL